MADFDSTGVSGGADQGAGSGGIGGGSTPSVSSASPSPSTSAGAGANVQQGNAYDLSDDTPVRVPGQAEPIKYGDLAKRLQADYTKKTQEAARQRQQYEQERSAWQAEKQQQEQQLKQLAAELLTRARQGQGGNQEGDFLSQISSMPYIDGKTAAALFKQIRENDIGQVTEAINQRDQLIEGLYRQLTNLGRTVQQLQGRYTTQSFESKIGQTLKDLGLPPEAGDFAKEIYLAYEGDDLDQEFPTILQNRWNQIQNLLRAQDRARVEAARRQPFNLPGRGGNGTAGAPLGLKGNESAREVTDFLWERLHPSSDV